MVVFSEACPNHWLIVAKSAPALSKWIAVVVHRWLV
jgi:hypothetical protein